MPAENENRFTIPLIAVSAVAMIAFAVLWGQQQHELMADGIYKLGFFGLMGLFVILAVIAEVRRGYPENTWKILCMVAAVAFCIWCGAWKSDRAAKESEGIEYKYPGT